MRAGLWAIAAALLFSTATAWAGPWTRDQGSFFVEASYSRLTSRTLFLSSFDPARNPTPNATNNAYEFCPRPTSCRYIQQLVNVYGEVGIINRWLTATLNATLLRTNELEGQGRTYGLGDWTFGLWTGLVTSPVRLAFGLTVGIPLGDPRPTLGPNADPDAEATARSLPTGDGEWDLDGRLSLGYSFGGKPRWPLMHYVLAEAGYWVRTGRFSSRGVERRFSDAFVYRGEFGIKPPGKIIDRFWFAFKLNGVESFADDQSAAAGATGLGNGVTYVVLGGQAYFRIWRGLGIAASYERAVRGRSIATGDFIKFGLSYQR